MKSSSNAGYQVKPALKSQDFRHLLHRFSQEQVKIQELLGNLAYALRSFNNLNQFLELIPLVASTITDTDGAALFLAKGDGLKLEVCHCPIEGRHGISSQQIRHALERVITTSRDRPKSNLDSLVSEALGNQLHLFATSVVQKNVVVGRLYVFSRAAAYTLTETRQKLLRLVADQTAVALEQHNLAAQLLQKQRQDRELEIGAEIQRQLLPRSNPNIPGLDIAACCHAANRVGGDYYDFIRINHSDRWGIVIGDVMGKGVPAGLIMTMTRGMLRAEVFNGHSPSQILSHLNQAMYEDLEKSHRFLTMFYSEYDPASSCLRYSNAAHLPVLWWRSPKVQGLDTMGALIGLESNSEFEEGRVKLQPGDVLLYYTDGVTEATNQTADRFDEDQLRLCLQHACQQQYSAQQILEYISHRVQKFIGTTYYQDDMTLVILKVLERDR
ncbi:MAG: SpoIIE family protein phosphatase [Pseudanabaenaceae cyanobacterium bins.68]|nr:SpoIIE family protein phosphatase [Pseudanabaenaceae cyanobacterium bins.68]